MLEVVYNLYTTLFIVVPEIGHYIEFKV